MADSKFYESYSRWNDDTNKYETWEEAVDRVMNMHRTKYKDKMTDELSDELDFTAEIYKQKRILGAQRALQFGGDQLLSHQMRIYNCTSGHINRVAAFGEYTYLLLAGAGVGFSIQKHHVEMVPKIQKRKKQAKMFVIPDSIEGWSEAVDVLMSSYFVGGGKHPEYEGRRVFFDFSKIRPQGAYISGGFKAPGPEPLRNGLNKIEQLLDKLLENDEVIKMRPIHVYDVLMFIADFVISGGVRRSATIAMFSLDDEEMMNAKTGNWFKDNPQRRRSNISAVVIKDKDTKEDFLKVFNSTKAFGEPGFLFLDSTEFTFNPCAEISKFPVTADGRSGWQGCCLAEINGAKSNSEAAFYENCRAASIICTLQAGYTDFKFVDDATKEIFEREALIGVSITGFMNSPDILFNEEILQKGAKIVVETNQKIAKMIGINPAARTTTTKPSGNASVLLCTASGIHAEHAKRYLRYVEMNNDQEVCKMISENNQYMVEPKKNNEDTTSVISYAITPPEGSITREELTGVDFLKKVKLVQENWIEYGTVPEYCTDPRLRHNVSNTVTVPDDEWDEVADFIWENRKTFAGISLLGDFGDKDYYQAPFTEVKTSEQIVSEYGDAAMFASGLIVDSHKGFDNLWDACDIVLYGKDQQGEIGDLRCDWIRRFKKYAETYFNNDYRKASYCLKDVHLLHKWNKIVKNFKPVYFKNLGRKEYTEIATMGAIACHGGSCEIV